MKSFNTVSKVSLLQDMDIKQEKDFLYNTSINDCYIVKFY